MRVLCCLILNALEIKRNVNTIQLYYLKYILLKNNLSKILDKSLTQENLKIFENMTIFFEQEKISTD